MGNDSANRLGRSDLEGNLALRTDESTALTPTAEAFMDCFSGDQEQIVNSLLAALEKEGNIDECVQQSAALRVLRTGFPQEFEVLFEQVRGLLAVVETLGKVAVEGARGKIVEFVNAHRNDLILMASVLNHPREASEGLLKAINPVPDLLAVDPLAPTDGEVEAALSYHEVFDRHLRELEKIQIRIENVLIMDAVSFYREGRKVGHARVGRIDQKPTDIPLEIKNSSQGYFWIDPESGKVTFAAAKDLRDRLQLDICRAAQKWGYEATFDEKKGNYVDGERYASGYTSPGSQSYIFTVNLKRIEE